MSNGLTRGVPAQELPENQAPEVAYVLDETTGAKAFPREVGTLVEEEKPKRRGRKPKAQEAESEEIVEEAAAVEDALPRELGS